MDSGWRAGARVLTHRAEGPLEKVLPERGVKGSASEGRTQGPRGTAMAPHPKGWGRAKAWQADAEGEGAEEVGERSRMEVVAMPVTQGPGEALMRVTEL